MAVQSPLKSGRWSGKFLMDVPLKLRKSQKIARAILGTLDPLDAFLSPRLRWSIGEASLTRGARPSDRVIQFIWNESDGCDYANLKS